MRLPSSPRVRGSTRTACAAVPPELATKLQYNLTRLAKAKPDECFNGIGQPYPVGPPCAEGQSKVNQAYVWGLTRIGNDVWFGTGANVNCLVSGATHLDTETIREFFAHGMLCNVLAAIDLRSVDEPWAQSFFDGEDEAKQQALSTLGNAATTPTSADAGVA